MGGRLFMLGLSHHATPIDIRERVAVDERVWRAGAPNTLGTVLLSTCNRVEVYAWIEGSTRHATRSLSRCLSKAASMDEADLRPHLITRAGREAVLHLIRVTSGLDSLVVGEEQIRAQVREALRCAEEAQQLPAVLRGAFHRAIEASRRIQSSTRLGQAPSIASAGVAVACRGVGSSITGQLAVVLGAGVVARAAAEALIARGARVRVLNRTPAHAQRVMAAIRGDIEIDSLAALPSALAEAALVVGATASRQPVVNREEVESAVRARGDRSLVLLDVALPRDIDPAVRDLAGVKLIDLDDLEALCPVDDAARNAERQQAEALAVEECERLSEWLRFRAVTPAITELRGYAEAIRTAELQRSASRLRDLTPEQIAAVEALTSGIVNKLMHGPTVALREAARSRGGSSRILGVVRPARRRTA